MLLCLYKPSKKKNNKRAHIAKSIETMLKKFCALNKLCKNVVCVQPLDATPLLKAKIVICSLQRHFICHKP